MQYTNRIVLLSIFDSILVFQNRAKNKKLKGVLGNFDRWLRFLKEPHYDDSVNIITRKKNELIEKVANMHNVVFCDINAIMKRTKYKRIDHIHFERKSFNFICKIYADCIWDILEC